MKKILVPTDFSACANKALQMAAMIAKNMGASVHLLHIVSVPSDWVQLHKKTEELHSKTQSEIANVEIMLNELKQKSCLTGIEVSSEIGYNLQPSDIAKVASDNKFDLIVMGTKGVSKLSKVILGSITQNVVRLATCPVITVHPNYKASPIKRIVVATDFTETDKMLETMNQVVALAHVFDADIRIVVIKDIYSDNHTLYPGIWKELVKQHFASISTVFVDIFDTVEEGVISFASETKADLIVIATEGKTGFKRLLQGSLSETLVNYSPIPVMVTHLENPNYPSSIFNVDQVTEVIKKEEK